MYNQCPSNAHQSNEDLYTCYVRYMEEGRRLILQDLESDKAREHFLRTFRIVTRDEFDARMKSVASHPESQRILEQLFRGGFSQPLMSHEKRRWRKLLPDVFSDEE